MRCSSGPRVKALVHPLEGMHVREACGVMLQYNECHMCSARTLHAGMPTTPNRTPWSCITEGHAIVLLGSCQGAGTTGIATQEQSTDVCCNVVPT